MRIVIDMQGAQSASSRNRGIGRYTLSLAQAIVRNHGAHEVFLALNGLFPDTIEPIRAVFDGLLPQENIRVWQAPGPVYSLSNGNNWRRRTAELVREAFLASLKPDIVLVSSLFEGLNDDAVTGIGTLSRTVPTAVILYDLIPLIHREPYLGNPVVEAWYENKLDHLRRADLLLAISESSRQDGIRYLGFPAVAAINISAAAEPQFQPQQLDAERIKEVRQRYGLRYPFVMYTGGIDHRKNIEGLIRAYAKLPKSLRASHQLAVICSVQPPSRAALGTIAKAQGLGNNELVLTGFVPEEDLLTLYNLCKVFVFPSWYEGFGLPALEAMACGRAVIAANTSSLPEVIGREDALFDPRDDQSIVAKLETVLTDEAFRTELERHGVEQAKRFSWDQSAGRTLAALETLHARRLVGASSTPRPSRRPTLAYISPLPSERSGISDYSAELLPELARHYDIEVIVTQDGVSDPWITANCPIRDIAWFRAHTRYYDRVLYHFGNSTFHQHMFDLLPEHPGVVVLHDFFLSGIISHMDVYGLKPHGWTQGLYRSHGYRAAQERCQAKDVADAVWTYPCNLEVLQGALGVIVHSEYPRSFARQWYGPEADKNWCVIPHLRVPTVALDRAAARRRLDVADGDFIICSYGLLGPTKLNHRLLAAWLASSLAEDRRCRLILVGENHSGDYGAKLLAAIRNSPHRKRIQITGWVDGSTFRCWLAATDVAVQLRACSRGETSGTALDCMNHSLATIVNAHGSLAELPRDAVWMLNDEFTDAELIQALEALRRDDTRRRVLGQYAREVILTLHQPRACAGQYAEAIERFYNHAAHGVRALVRSIASIEPVLSDKDVLNVATAIAQNQPPHPRCKQLLVDISELATHDAKTGSQSVVRTILSELLRNPPAGYTVEPVYATTETPGYRYARHFTSRFLNIDGAWAIDEPIEYQTGDSFLGLDYQPHVVSAQKSFYRQLRGHGIEVQFIVYDLLCVAMPHHFVEGAVEWHRRWLETVAEGDGAVCISKAVADEVSAWIENHCPERLRPFRVSWFHLGADSENVTPSRGMPKDASRVLASLADRPSLLMVGTLEPRKGYAQALGALEQLWQEGVEVNLVIVGKQGGMVDELVKTLRHHPEMGNRLFWLEGISDEYLEKVYKASTCVIAASEGEGFGLPLIEAARYKVPIISRDIPVFREVAGEHAFYFHGDKPTDLAEAVREWLRLYEFHAYPGSDGMPWLTWEESVEKLKTIILKGDWFFRLGSDRSAPDDAGGSKEC